MSDLPELLSEWPVSVTKKSKEELDIFEDEKNNVPEEIPIMITGMKKMYKEKLLPIESMYHYDQFASPSFKDSFFDAKPMVLLIGQYSVGKTTFIRYLLERDFPGVRIGPEPTTDRFMVLMWGPADRTIPGNALCADASKPFTQLTKFGMGFLNKFECAECASPILQKVTFIDTPGILSGEKQRVGRGYEFPVMCEWFAGRCDRILLLFDAHKLDISDEMKATIEKLRQNDDKIRVVLNKADIPTQQLVRVYGALMWSLGKVFQTPEVLRVYVGSFWDQPLKNQENQELMTLEEKDLLADLRTLPKNVAVRKVNEVIKRARRVKIHVYLMITIKEQISGMTANKKAANQKKLLDISTKGKGLFTSFTKTKDTYGLPKNDFPKPPRFSEAANKLEIWKIDPKKKYKKLMPVLEDMLTKDMPKLMSMVPSELQDGELESKDGAINPFAERSDTALQMVSWCINSTMEKGFEMEFDKLPKTGEKVMASDAGAALKHFSKDITQDTLRKIWELSDIDGDFALDLAEWCVARYLVEKCLAHDSKENLPDSLPDALIPPGKRYCFKNAL